MQVACSTLCFGRLSLEEAFARMRELQFAKIDLAIHEEGPHLTPSEATADPVKISQLLRRANLPFSSFGLHFSLEDELVVREQFRGLCRLARMLSVPVLTVNPAIITSELEWKEEIVRLKIWTQIAEKEGVILALETRQGTCTDHPEQAWQICQAIPGLGISLDPSHYISRDREMLDFDQLLPRTRHVRFRDSGPNPEQFQMMIGQGVIEYGKIMHQLDRLGFERAVSVDIRDIPDGPFPTDPEIRKLKYLLESMT